MLACAPMCPPAGSQRLWRPASVRDSRDRRPRWLAHFCERGDEVDTLWYTPKGLSLLANVAKLLSTNVGVVAERLKAAVC